MTNNTILLLVIIFASSVFPIIKANSFQIIENNLYYSCQELQFILVGDAGYEERDTFKHSLETTKSLVEKFTKNCSISVALGDNFYKVGISKNLGVNDPRLKWLNSLPTQEFYGVLGNHDYFKEIDPLKFKADEYGDFQAQINYASSALNAVRDYSTKDGNSGSRWIMDDHNYSRLLNFSNGNRKVLLIFLDTNNYKFKDTYYWRVAQTSEWLRLFWATNKSFIQSEVDDIFVFSHYSILSKCSEKKDLKITAELYSSILPILMEMKVDAFVSAHNHIVEYSKYSSPMYPDYFLNQVIIGAYSQTEACQLEDTLGYVKEELRAVDNPMNYNPAGDFLVDHEMHDKTISVGTLTLRSDPVFENGSLVPQKGVEVKYIKSEASQLSNVSASSHDGREVMMSRTIGNLIKIDSDSSESFSISNSLMGFVAILSTVVLLLLL